MFKSRQTFKKVDRAQAANFGSEIGNELGSTPEGTGPTTNAAVISKRLKSKRVVDPGHGKTPRKIKKGYKNRIRKQAPATHSMQSFGGKL